MKKTPLVLVIAIAMAAGMTFLIVKLQKRSALEHLEHLTRIPASKPHQHVSPSGEIVQHTHNYDTPKSVASTGIESEENNIEIGTDDKDYMKTNNIQRIWSNLDLDAIKKEFQPYTLAETHEKWRNHPYVPKFTDRTSGTDESPLTAVEKLDNFRNRDEWIQRLYDLGYPFLRGGQYNGALQTRSALKRIYETENESYPHGSVGLPPEATWEEVEDTFMKHQVISEIAFERAYQADPDNFAGGVFNISDMGKGVLTPFKENTVYVHISEDKPFSQVMGTKLTTTEEKVLTMFGIAPDGMKVVYTDKNGIPLPPDHKPRFYERVMKSLDAAEKQVMQQISDHDALFNQAENGTGQKTSPILGETQHNHPHPHEEVSPTRTTQKSDTQQKTPSQVGRNRQRPLPPEPPSPAQVQKWFEELVLLHGGELPKDLKTLQEVIKELEAIRKQGREKLPKPPRRPPERPTPPKTPSEQ